MVYHEKRKWFIQSRQDFWLRLSLSVVVLVHGACAGSLMAQEYTLQETSEYQEDTQQETLEYQEETYQSEYLDYFKLFATVEYEGQKAPQIDDSQFRSQVNSIFTAEKDFLLEGQFTKYYVYTDDFDLVSNNQVFGIQSNYGGLSFVVDRHSNAMSDINSEEMKLFERINNHIADQLKKKTRENLGKEWNQSFELTGSEAYSLPKKVDFTVKAIKVKTLTEDPVDMIAVRAMSSAFEIRTVTDNDEIGELLCRTAALYIFDMEMEMTYLTVSLFHCQTTANEYPESFKHEFVTFMAEQDGAYFNTMSLGQDVEKLVDGMGLTEDEEMLYVTNQSDLPVWALTDGITGFGMSNACTALLCEGALNPVSQTYIPAVQTGILQCQAIAGVGPQLVDECEIWEDDPRTVRSWLVFGKKNDLFWLFLAAIPLSIHRGHHHHHKPIIPPPPVPRTPSVP